MMSTSTNINKQKIIQPTSDKNVVCTVFEPVRNPYYADVVVAIIFSLSVIGLLVYIFVILIEDSNRSGNTADVSVYVRNTNPITSNAGASTNGFFANGNNAEDISDIISCQSNLTSTWSVDKCQCVIPFYDSNCNFESHNIRYKAIGNPNTISDIVVPPSVSMENINRLSFDFAAISNSQTKCTKICDNDDECTGVSWLPGGGINRDNNTCIIHKGPVIVKEGRNIPYSNSVMPTLYLKGRGNPKFIDRAFVYTGTRQNRYWLIESGFRGGQSQQLTMFKNVVYNLKFRPINLVNDANFVGIFCNASFTMNMLPGIINASSLLDNNKVINPNVQKNKLLNNADINSSAYDIYFSQLIDSYSYYPPHKQFDKYFSYNNMECYIYCPGENFEIPSRWSPNDIYGVFTDWISNK